MAADPRLTNHELLALAAMRVKQRQRLLRPEPSRPEPDAHWWQELWLLINSSPWRGDILAPLRASHPSEG